jgi:hypothetical protein
MRAKEEYEKWCLVGGYLSNEQGQRSYVTGFNRAIELIEQLLKEQENEFEHTTQG